MSKDIILFTSGGKKSGVYRVESELVDEWIRQGHIVSFVNANGRIIYDASGHVDAPSVESKFKPLTLIRRFIKLRHFFRYHPDATIVALSITADCFAAIFGLTVKNRVVVSERNDPAQYPASKTYRKFRDICFRLADACVFQTEDAKRYFSRGVQKKGVVIPNPINDKIPEFDNLGRKKIVMSTGRLKEQKNYPMLIRAFAKFLDHFPDYTLEIYGEGNQINELIALTRKLDVEKKVSFKKFTDDIWPLMARASMFVMSSNYEGISNSMLEALAIGLPTICTDCPVGGARQMIDDGINGLLVPVGDVDALAKAMVSVASNEDFAKKLGDNAHKIRQKYPLNVIASKWIGVM